jgi:Zn-dependent protease with chaperone function
MRKTLGISLGQNEQRKLWGITAAIGREIEAKPIDSIVITPLPGIGVYLQGNLFTTILGGGTRVLQVGLPSLHGLTMDEFKAILVHEYGHFSNRDTQWGSFTYSMGNALLTTFRSMPGPGKSGSMGGGMVGLVMWLNPAYWILLVFVRLYFRLTNGFSRIREVMADVAAMTLCGGKAFGQGLLKVATNDELFVKVVHAKLVPKLLEKEKTIPNFSKTLDQAYTSIGKRALGEIQAAILSRSQTHSVYDSHPALKVRLDYAKKFETGKEKYAGPVRELFEDWDRLNEKAAELYYQRLFS